MPGLGASAAGAEPRFLDYEALSTAETSQWLSHCLYTWKLTFPGSPAPFQVLFGVSSWFSPSLLPSLWLFSSLIGEEAS